MGTWHWLLAWSSSFPTGRGGLSKPQSSGTLSLLYRFEMDGDSVMYGAFLMAASVGIGSPETNGRPLGIGVTKLSTRCCMWRH